MMSKLICSVVNTVAGGLTQCHSHPRMGCGWTMAGVTRFLIVTLVALVCHCGANPRLASSVVNTQSGRVRGLLIERRPLVAVEAYLGLQYASVRGGTLRFMPPTAPSDKWTGVHMAIKFRPVCPQKVPDVAQLEGRLPRSRVQHYERLVPFLQDQAEECLYLNIYRPVPAAANETTHLPVLVFVHGETYDTGTGNAYDVSVIAAYNNVIVVTLNYRLGVLGFLSTGDSNAPGNYGLLDQMAALHWLQKNLAAFGGDTRRVTLLGHGHGAALVNMLLVSPVTKGHRLFQRAILLSGSGLSDWAVSRRPTAYVQQLSTLVNCTDHLGNTPELLRCLQDTSYAALVSASVTPTKHPTGFGPVIHDRSILPRDIDTLMTLPLSDFGDTDLLVGMTTGDGVTYFSQEELGGGGEEQLIYAYVKSNFESEQQEEISALLGYLYRAWPAPLNVRSVVDLVTDSQYAAPLIRLLQSHAPHSGATYFYCFNYPTHTTDSTLRGLEGAYGDDMTYIFGAPLANSVSPFPTVFTLSQRVLSQAVMTHIGNFIKTGNPNKAPPGSHKSTVEIDKYTQVDWPPYDNDKQQYFHVGQHGSVRTHYRSAKMELWLRLLPKLRMTSETRPLVAKDDNTSSHPVIPMSNTAVDVALAAPPTTVTITKTTKTRTRYDVVPTKWSKLPTKSNKVNDAASTLRPLVAGSHGGKDGTLSLSLTIAVGCSLLFLSIVIFVSAHYQKDRLRTRLHCEQEKLASFKDNIIIARTKSSSSDSDTSSVDAPLFRPSPHSGAAARRATPVTPPRVPSASPGTKSLPDPETLHSPNRLRTSLSTEFTNKKNSIFHGPSTVV